MTLIEFYLMLSSVGFPTMFFLWLWERKYPLKLAQAERAWFIERFRVVHQKLDEIETRWGRKR